MVRCHEQDQVKQETKFFSRLVSKDASRSNSSCRDRFLLYYGGASGAIPFVWESRPGTPKHSLLLSDASDLAPPLTPPPSHQPISRSRPRSRPISTILFPSRRNKRTHAAASPSLSSGSSSSSSSWSSSSSPSYFKTNKPKSKSSSKRAIRYEDDYGSMGVSKRFNGCVPVGRVIKSALMSLVGRSSSGRQGVRR